LGWFSSSAPGPVSTADAVVIRSLSIHCLQLPYLYLDV
jgi:hypothetical protein